MKRKPKEEVKLIIYLTKFYRVLVTFFRQEEDGGIKR